MRDPARLAAAVLVLVACAGVARLSDPVARLPEAAVWIALATIGWGVGWQRAAAGGRHGVVLVVAVAAAARALLVIPTTPLSDDLYRYLWDGRVANAGIEPFRYTPAAEELASLRDDAVWPRINHPSVPTIYPPVAQLYFRALDTIAPTARTPRVAAAALDLLTTVLLALLLRRRGRPATLAVAHGWCPLAILESAGGGHVDALGAGLLLAGLLVLVEGRGRRTSFAGGALLAASALVKPAAALLAPLILAGPVPRRRWLLAGGAAVLLLWLPHLDAGARVTTGFRAYAEHWQFNDALYTPLVRGGVPPRTARIALALLLLTASIVIGRRVPDPLVASALALGALFVCSPTVYPWYASWLVPLLPFLPGRIRPAGIAFVTLLPISYVTAWQESRTGEWRELDWPRALLWGVVFLVLLSGWVGPAGERAASVSASSRAGSGGA